MDIVYRFHYLTWWRTQNMIITLQEEVGLGSID